MEKSTKVMLGFLALASSIFFFILYNVLDNMNLGPITAPSYNTLLKVFVIMGIPLFVLAVKETFT